jgi:GDP-4-dehydro-6-deoxy-D-mannose reductase
VATRVLVTGAAGFAGSHLVERLVSSGADVVGWTHRGGHAPPAGVCAGVAQSGGAPSRVAPTLEVNVRGTAHLLAAVERHAPAARVVVTSSALVYRPSAEPLVETSPIGPAGPYAVSKLAQDTLARHAARGLDVVVARPFNHIGPRQSPDFVASSVARQIVLAERGEGPAELHVGNLSAIRDFTDVRDVVRAYEAVAAHGFAGECYNVCSGRGIAIQDLVDGLVARSRVPIRVVTDPARFRPVDVPVVVGSAAKLELLCGWQTEIPLDRTLDDLLDWWRQRDQ